MGGSCSLHYNSYELRYITSWNDKTYRSLTDVREEGRDNTGESYKFRGF